MEVLREQIADVVFSPYMSNHNRNDGHRRCRVGSLPANYRFIVANIALSAMSMRCVRVPKILG